MKLPLAVFSLLLLAALLAFYLAEGLADRGSRRRSGASASPGRLRMALRRIVKDGMRLYLPFGAVAVLMVSLGKPERLPQAAAWLVVVAYGLQVIAIAAERRGLRTVLAVVAALAVVYLWVLQLPFFNVIPL